MPKIADDLGPIRYTAVEGPALDAWNARKEENNSSEASTSDFRHNFDSLKDAIGSDINRLVASSR